jgi:RNA polymerase sigma-70 factor (ECF subfamily)
MEVPSEDRSHWLARRVLPHEPSLRRWLRGFSALDETDVDDLVQETYAVLATRATVSDIVDPRAYAFQTARSLFLQGVRRAKIVSFQAMADLAGLDIPDDAPSPFQHVAGREDLRQISAAIAAMPPQTRRTFLLRRVDGLSQREVAAATNLSESTVEKHIGRGIRILMKQFGRGGKAKSGASPEREDDLTLEMTDVTQESSTPNARSRDRQQHR